MSVRRATLGVSVLLGSALVWTGLVPLPVGAGGAVASGSAAVAATGTGTPDPATLGRSADTAAGSCWEIKQVAPAAPSGAYWLLTPSMTAPQQLWCDQVTDGGGWVLVGKGRDAWTANYTGKGREKDLTTPDLATMSSTTTAAALHPRRPAAERCPGQLADRRRAAAPGQGRGGSDLAGVPLPARRPATGGCGPSARPTR